MHEVLVDGRMHARTDRRRTNGRTDGQTTNERTDGRTPEKRKIQSVSQTIDLAVTIKTHTESSKSELSSRGKRPFKVLRTLVRGLDLLKVLNPHHTLQMVIQSIFHVLHL